MASRARDLLLRNVDAFRAAVDSDQVRSGNDVGDLLRRGLTVAGFNLLEAFVEARLAEVAAYVNAGIATFVDLPESLQRRAILNTISVAQGRARRLGSATPIDTMRSFSAGVGASLGAVHRSLELSAFTWLWHGSNMAPTDYVAILKYFHAPGWSTATSLAGRMGFSSIDLETDLASLAHERHLCAHDSHHGVTAMWIRTLPERILGLAAPLDVLVSTGATQFHDGNRAFIADPDWLSGRVKLRFVRERSTGAAEYVEGSARAYRRGPDVGGLWVDAALRCGDLDALVAQNRLGAVTAWSIPTVG